MGIQSSINGLVGSVLGVAAAKSIAKKDVSTVEPPKVDSNGQEPTKSVNASQKGVKQQEIVAASETKLAKNPGYDKLPANSMGMLNNPALFSTYSEHAESVSMDNMAKEVQGRFKQREQFKKRITASRKRLGGR